MASKPIIACLTFALLAAGCTAPAEGLDDDSFDLRVDGIPDTVQAGEEFTFTLHAEGQAEASSSHIGAHYWMEAPEDPTAGLSDALGCAHTEESTQVPGTYTVRCTIEEAGTWHVYGHVRIEEDGHRHEYWAEGHQVMVQA